MNAKLIKFEIKELPDLRVIGKEIIIKMSEFQQHNPIPEFWGKCLNDNTFGYLEQELKDQMYSPDYVGYMQMLNADEFTNVCGILMKPDAPVPDGYVSYDVKAFTSGVSWIQGTEPDIYIGEHTLTEPEIDKAGYKYDESKGFTIEAYNCPRYTQPDENGNRIIDYYVPMVKK